MSEFGADGDVDAEPVGLDVISVIGVDRIPSPSVPVIYHRRWSAHARTQCMSPPHAHKLLRNQMTSRVMGACAILVLASAGACVRGRAPGGAVPSSSQCRITPERYDTLRVGSDPVYVEPDAVEVDGDGRMLIMGPNTYRFSRASGDWEMVEEQIFALVVDRDRRVQIVPPPISAKRFSGMRALPNGRGWSVVFAEMTYPDPPGLDAAVALWHAEFDGSRWTAVERLPTPDSIAGAALASSLARTAKGLVWMVPIETAGAGLLVLKRESGVWHGETVPTLAATAEPLVLPSGDLMLAAIQGDTTLMSDGNSLLLRAERTGWGVVAVLRRSQEEPVLQLASRNWGRVSILSWKTKLAPQSNMAIRAFVTNGGQQRIVTVDSATGPTSSLTPVEHPQMGPTWVTAHQLASGGTQIFFSSLDSSGTIVRRGAFPNPFIAGFAAATRGGTFVVTGPVPSSKEEYVASLIIEYSVQCEASSN